MQEREPAPKDGVQIYNGTRFRAVRGELMMPGAKFVDPVAEAKAAAEAEAKAKAGKSGPKETS